MASQPFMINQSPNTYGKEFLKVATLSANPTFMNQDKTGVRSTLYSVYGAHDRKVTQLNPQYDPKFKFRQTSNGDGMQHTPMKIPCGKPNQINKFSIQKYAEKNANLYPL